MPHANYAVNDAGFSLVKEPFSLSASQTIATWPVMETALSLLGYGFADLLWALT